MVWGGYPKAVLEQDVASRQRYIEDIYTSYVRKDIKDIARLDNVAGFNRLVKLLALQIGCLANFSELCLSARIARETLDRYLFLLENTFVIRLLQPHFTNQRKEIVKMPKVYFVDTGLRNAVAAGFQALDTRSDSGGLVENAVLAQWMRTSSFHAVSVESPKYWRSQGGAEVDFIFPLDDGEVLPVEVKWQRLKTVSVPSGMRSFIEAYKPRNALILTKGLSGKTGVKETSVHFLPAWLFCGNAGH